MFTLEMEINKGSRQGEILPPFWLNLCTKECIEDIANHDVGCRTLLTKWNALAYADDIVFVAKWLIYIYSIYIYIYYLYFDL